jgi:hypothetical protein
MFALVDCELAADDTARVLMLVGVESEAQEIAGELRRRGRRVDVRTIRHAAGPPRTPAPRTGRQGSDGSASRHRCDRRRRSTGEPARPRFPDTPRSEIGDLVRGEVATFIDAPVQTYFEVLVHRRVAERMSGAEAAP